MYDRQEVNEVLQYFVKVGIAYYRQRISGTESRASAGPPSNEESRSVFWFVDSEKHWYEV